ncbi:hypothetical protein NUW58_g8614 [Xylaria curta]|uniref:Uncharacterized protein n=1 Tax=Xylaria curta TaxID=42375 RepID=A0ACC1N6P8_9PEZI|nr:hypothetical protein NUW58_g8614 [Xylaria curta]
MNTFSCQCYTSGALDRFAAQKRLDDLVTGPWYTNSKEKEDAARIRHHIKILKATNAFDVAELLDIAHCCTAFHPDVSPAATDSCGTALAGALIHDTRRRLSSMERLTARIRERNGQVKKLEHHLKIYGMILRSLDVVLPGDGTTYSYKIDPRNGISLIIQAADNSDAKSQVSSENTDLVDLAIVPCISTPVLKPVCISPPTRAPTTLAAEQSAQEQAQRNK